MGFPPCRSRKRPSPPEGRGPDFGPLRALHLKHTFLPACHRKVSTDMLAIGFSPCLSKKRPSQGPNGQALRNMAEKIVQAGRTSGLACWPAVHHGRERSTSYHGPLPAWEQCVPMCSPPTADVTTNCSHVWSARAKNASGWPSLVQ